MLIGIDASRAFQKERTGIEEYSYQVIKHLRDRLRDESSFAKASKEKQIILYCNPAVNDCPDFELPKNWKVKFLRAPIFWTQARLSLEMLFHPVDVLFVPAHTVPLIHPARNASRFQKILIWLSAQLCLLSKEAIKTHSDAGGPKNTIVTIHGLEYEFCPKAYSFWQRFYMRFVIKNSCRWAKRIIAVSESTKKDLVKLYRVPEEKIEVIYEGISSKARLLAFQGSTFPFPDYLSGNSSRSKLLNDKYLLFIGRLEERKNICGIIEAFEILKDKYNLPHKLVLAGKFGYGKEKIKNKIEESRYKEDILLTGHISDEKKFELMRKAEVFLFPTFYEGFGLPILEAQSVGTPVVTSNISSMPEISGSSAVLVDPKDPGAIAEAAYKIISDESYRNDIIKKGLVNVKRFSWEKCAEEIAEVICNL